MLNKDDRQMLLHFEQSYKDVMFNAEDQHKRAVKLAEVMTRMENYFRIPLVGKDRMENFQRDYPDVWELYVMVSTGRR